MLPAPSDRVAPRDVERPEWCLELGSGRIWLRSLRGTDERSVAGTGVRDACALLDRVLLEAPGALAGPGEGASLTVAERDRALAALYVHTYGDQVGATATCPACGERYDLDFSVSALTGAPLARNATLHDGTPLRVPTGEDELAVAHLPASEASGALLHRCAGDHADGLDLEAAATALEAAAPILDLDAEATCPECGTAHTLRFSMQGYLLGTLLRERRRLLEEIHLLARGYGWALPDILSLTRTERRTLVQFLDHGRSA